VSPVTYKLDLRGRVQVHNVFHVSKLQKFHGVPTRIDYLNGEYEILDPQTMQTSSSAIVPFSHPTVVDIHENVESSDDTPQVEDTEPIPFGKKKEYHIVTFPEYAEYDSEAEVCIESESEHEDITTSSKVVEKIIKCQIRKIPQGSKRRPQQVLEYLVKYKNKPDFENEWLTIEELQDYKELVAAFDANPIT